eukprot:GHVT01098254.1.p1 GENE.GHVT01098254.1~~GHVT01098254.1.p1  ORF type:complete len:110 (-),score=21.12 GHVT01098254.1:744-1073(-)
MHQGQREPQKSHRAAAERSEAERLRGGFPRNHVGRPSGQKAVQTQSENASGSSPNIPQTGAKRPQARACKETEGATSGSDINRQEAVGRGSTASSGRSVAKKGKANNSL